MSRGARIAAWCVGGLVLLILIGIATIIIIGNTAAGRRLLESETAKLTSGKVRIMGLSGSFPATINLASLELSDPKGVWMSARQVSLHWSPLALFAWRMHIESLDIRTPSTEQLAVNLSALPPRARARAATAPVCRASTSTGWRLAPWCSHRPRQA